MYVGKNCPLTLLLPYQSVLKTEVIIMITRVRG